jgi:hypothetical protein
MNRAPKKAFSVLNRAFVSRCQDRWLSLTVIPAFAGMTVRGNGVKGGVQMHALKKAPKHPEYVQGYEIHNPAPVLRSTAKRMAGAGRAQHLMLCLGVLAKLIFEFAYLFFRFGMADAIALFDFVDQIVGAACADLEIVVGELAPMLLDVRGKAFPLAADHAFVHDISSFS